MGKIFQMRAISTPYGTGRPCNRERLTLVLRRALPNSSEGEPLRPPYWRPDRGGRERSTAVSRIMQSAATYTPGTSVPTKPSGNNTLS